MNRIRLIPILIGLLLSGCSHVITAPTPPVRSAPKHVLDSSTQVGNEVRTTVGNAVLKVKDYWVTTIAADAMTPSSGFTMKGGSIVITVADGQNLRIIGATQVDGKSYTVLRAPGTNLLLLADSITGKLASKVINNADELSVVMVWDFKSIPENITFTSSKIEATVSERAYTNYEFIYSGKSGSTINFLYREFTAADIARPSFFQNVSYDASQKEIEFKSIKLEVTEVSSNAITVRVAAL